jgi:hypothetical protein
MTAQPKKIIRDMTVFEVSSVDRPAVKGATAVLFKSEGAALRKNAAEVAAGTAEPLYKAAQYGDAMMARAGEIAAEKACTAGQALLNHSGSDPVLIELAHAERSAEMAVMKAQSSRRFSFDQTATRAAMLPPVRPEQRHCMLCAKSFESSHPRASHQMCDECIGA